MFYKWFVSEFNNEQVLYLYIENSYEIANEIFKNDKKDSLHKKINDYIKSNNIIYNGQKIFIVSNNLIIGSVSINNKELNVKKFIDLDNIFDEEIEIIDVSNDNDEEEKLNKKSINEYIKRILNQNIEDFLERESIKALVIIIRTNCMKDIEKQGYINDLNKYINYNITEKNNHILEIINETENKYLKTNNILSYIPILFTDKNYIKELNTMAKAGYNCEQIISHFYPDAQIVNE